MNRTSAEPRGRELGRPALAAILVALSLAGCAAPDPSRRSSPSPSGPTATVPRVVSPSASTTLPAATSSPAGLKTSPPPPDFSGLPALLVARVGAAGTTLWLTATGDPNARLPLALPAGAWRPDAASAGGRRIAFTALTGPSGVATARSSGAALVMGPRRALPPGLVGDDPRSGFVPCLSEAGDLMVADQALALHLVAASGQLGAILPAETLGSCAWSGQDAVFFDVDGTHDLGQWRLGAPKVALSDLKLTLPSVAGTTVAALSNDGLAGRAVVLSVAATTAAGTFAPTMVATLRPAEGEAYTGLRLSEDGLWLVAWGGPEGDAPAWLDAYERTANGFKLIGRTPFRADEDVRAIVSAP